MALFKDGNKKKTITRDCDGYIESLVWKIERSQSRLMLRFLDFARNDMMSSLRSNPAIRRAAGPGLSSERRKGEKAAGCSRGLPLVS